MNAIEVSAVAVQGERAVADHDSEQEVSDLTRLLAAGQIELASGPLSRQELQWRKTVVDTSGFMEARETAEVTKGTEVSERRYLALSEVELRSAASSRDVIIGFIPYDSLSGVMPDKNGNPFREIVRPRAFERSYMDSLAGKLDVLARFQHQEAFGILGRTSSRTLRLFEDERGLRYEIDVPDTQQGRDVVESMRRKDVRASSFAFYNPVQKWTSDYAGRGSGRLRELLDLTLIDVAPVTTAAYTAATASLAMQSPIADGVRCGRYDGGLAAMKLRLDLEERL